MKRFFHCLIFFFVHREKDGVKKGESGEMKCLNDFFSSHFLQFFRSIKNNFDIFFSAMDVEMKN